MESYLIRLFDKVEISDYDLELVVFNFFFFSIEYNCYTIDECKLYINYVFIIIIL
jgi:hypothetical protein